MQKFNRIEVGTNEQQRILYRSYCMHKVLKLCDHSNSELKAVHATPSRIRRLIRFILYVITILKKYYNGIFGLLALYNFTEL